MERWVLAAVWVTLPFTAGAAAADALDGWSTAPAVVAAVLLWATWGAGLLAILVPRPVGLTAIRVIALDFAVAAAIVLVNGSAGTTAAVVALAATVVAALLVARPALAFAAANGSVYGDESRNPLRVPPALFLGLLPVARLVVGAAVATGPLLLADKRWIAGGLALAVGIPLGLFAARALHGLSVRWAVLVPAGFVIVDPLTLSDPVLFLREHIVSVGTAAAAAPATADALDLRLGASLGSCALVLDHAAELFRTGRGRRATTTVHARDIRIAVLDRSRLLADAAARRIPVIAERGSGARPQAATPPPTSASPS